MSLHFDRLSTADYLANTEAATFKPGVRGIYIVGDDGGDAEGGSDGGWEGCCGKDGGDTPSAAAVRLAQRQIKRWSVSFLGLVCALVAAIVRNLQRLHAKSRAFRLQNCRILVPKVRKRRKTLAQNHAEDL